MSGVSDQELVRQKPRRVHPAAIATAQFRQDTEHLRGNKTTESIPSGIVHNTVGGDAIPTSTIVSQPQPAASSTPGGTVEGSQAVAPIQNTQVPFGYVDVLAETMDNTLAPTVQNARPDLQDTTSSQENTQYQFQQQNAALLLELEETRRQLVEAQRIPEDLKHLKEERDIEDMLQQSGMDFNTIDPTDVKNILKPVLSTVRKQNTEVENQLRDQLQRQQNTLEEKLRKIEEREQMAVLEKVRSAILKEHPDLEALQKTEAYRNAMLSPIDGKAGILVGQLVAAEYKRGNTEYVIDVLNRIKSANPVLDGIVSINPTTTGGVPAAGGDTPPGRLTNEQIAEYRYQVQIGQMPREEFRTIMAKHRAAIK